MKKEVINFYNHARGLASSTVDQACECTKTYSALVSLAAPWYMCICANTAECLVTERIVNQIHLLLSQYVQNCSVTFCSKTKLAWHLPIYVTWETHTKVLSNYQI